MQLSETDQKLVARLKRRQQAFMRWRWVGLVGALILIGDGLFAFVPLRRAFLETDQIATLLVAVLFPTALALFVAGAGLLIYLVSHWHGREETRLLLSLIEDSRHDA